MLLDNSASPGLRGWGGGGLTPPPPSDPDFIVGKHEILQKELLIWLILVHNLLDFWVPGPAKPPSPPFLIHPFLGGGGGGLEGIRSQMVPVWNCIECGLCQREFRSWDPG